MSTLDITKIEKICDIIREVWVTHEPNKAEIINIIAHTTLEIGIALYKQEGGIWDSNENSWTKRIMKEQQITPSIGKILILYSVGLREIYLNYLESQFGTIDDTKEKNDP